MNTLFDVKHTVRTLIGDDEHGTLTDDYLVPKINFAYRTQTLALMQATGSNLEQVVEIPDSTDVNGNDASKGLTSLAALQQPGGLLDGLVEPLYLWWKPAGAPENQYREMLEKKTLPFVDPSTTGMWSQMCFTWRGNQLFVTPLNLPVDLLVDGRFAAHALTKNEDTMAIHPLMETTVTPASLALCGIEMGNVGFQQAGAQAAKDAADNLCNLIMMSKQGYTARAGSMSWRRAQRGYFWW